MVVCTAYMYKSSGIYMVYGINIYTWTEWGIWLPQPSLHTVTPVVPAAPGRSPSWGWVCASRSCSSRPGTTRWWPWWSPAVSTSTSSTKGESAGTDSAFACDPQVHTVLCVEIAHYCVFYALITGNGSCCWWRCSKLGAVCDTSGPVFLFVNYWHFQRLSQISSEVVVGEIKVWRNVSLTIQIRFQFNINVIMTGCFPA